MRCFGRIAAVCLVLCAGPPVFVATADSTAETVDVDIAACRQSNDKEACEQAYDYLTTQMTAAEAAQSAKGKKRTSGKSQAPEDFLPEMRSLAETGCAAGNAWLCGELGNAYRKGMLGLTEDETLALKYYAQACGLEYGYGCARQGVFHELGLGVPVDRAAAIKTWAWS